MFTYFITIQSIVVISPIGDQAPPAFAAIIIRPAYITLVTYLLLAFDNVIKTIVAVSYLLLLTKQMKTKNHKCNLSSSSTAVFFKSIKIIYNFNNCHCSQKENQNFSVLQDGVEVPLQCE